MKEIYQTCTLRANWLAECKNEKLGENWVLEIRGFTKLIAINRGMKIIRKDTKTVVNN